MDWLGRDYDRTSRVGKSWIFFVAVRMLALHHFEIIVCRVIKKAWSSWRWWFEIELGEFLGFVTDDGVVAVIGLPPPRTFLVAAFRELGVHNFEIDVRRVIPKTWSWRWWFEIELGEFLGFVTDDGVVAIMGRLFSCVVGLLCRPVDAGLFLGCFLGCVADESGGSRASGLSDFLVLSKESL